MVIAIAIILFLAHSSIGDDTDAFEDIVLEEISTLPPPCEYNPPQRLVFDSPFEMTPEYVPPSSFITGRVHRWRNRARHTTVFISFRTTEAEEFAADLKDKLRYYDIHAYVCDFSTTDESVLERIVDEIDSADLFVALGTETYGKKTDCIYSTRHQLIYAISNSKPLFHVRMCDRLQESIARFLLPQTLRGYYCQGCDRFAPDDLVTEIRDAALYARGGM
jgi:TIR domain